MHDIGRPTRGFEHVRRFWSNGLNCVVAKILPGEYYVSHGNELISTVLGSCVSACVRDTKSHFGAMNHFMLPDAGSAAQDDGAPFRYGAYAMEHMLNELIKAGVRKSDMEVKIAGGGNMLAGSKNLVGANNIAFVKDFLDSEGIAIAAQHVGDNVARQVLYDVVTGKMRIKSLERMDPSIAVAESNYQREISEPTTNAGEIDLF